MANNIHYIAQSTWSSCQYELLIWKLVYLVVVTASILIERLFNRFWSEAVEICVY